MNIKLRHWIICGATVVFSAIAVTTEHLRRKHKIELASTPTDLSAESWKKALLETKDALGNKNLTMYAAGIAYFGVLAFFPLVAAIVAVAGMALQPHQLSDAAANLATYLPKDIASMVTTQLEAATKHHASNVFVAIIGVALSIWSVSGAVQNVMKALNVSYDVEETRGFVKQKLVSIGLTIGAIIGGIMIALVFVSGSGFLKDLGVPGLFVDVFAWLRWVIVTVAAMIGFAVLYRYAPNREPTQKWQWVSWGAIMGTIGWILVSVIFFVYLAQFANFSKSYSTFAGLIGMMMWLNLSALMVLIGAEINHRLEARTVLPVGKS